MSGWKTPIRCYVSGAGNNLIADWYARLTVQEKADADEFLKDMRKTIASDWRMPSYRPSLWGLKGIGELRWHSEKKQHRLLGFFLDGAWIAVIGCTHKQQIYSPANALDTAKKYMNQIKGGKARPTVEYAL
ncbi:MAG: hypothetical protein ABSF54_21235 [Bryobacteraceae bacterium]|jgi:hypothetical protein